MPVVRPEKITIEIDGKVDKLEADLKKLNKEIDNFADANKKAEKSAGLTAKAATSSWTEFRSAYSTVLDIVRTGEQVWSATVGELVDYGDKVQRLSVITGQNAEVTSRQIQMADDLRVSYEALARGLQFASKKGIDTSIDGLVALGEEYKKLPKGIERTQFLTEKFGKSGVELNKILGQTEETIRKLAADTPDGLILDDADLAALKEYNRSIDNLTDSFTALKMEAAKALVPVTNDLIDASNAGIQFIKDIAAGNIEDAFINYGKSIMDAADRTSDLGDASVELGDDLGELEDPLKDAEEAAKALSKEFTGLLTSMFSINSENEKYAENVADMQQKDADLAAEKNRLTLQMWEEQAAGKMTNDEYLKYVQNLDEITKKQTENTEAIAKSAEEHAQAGEKRVFDLVQQRLAADGVISSGEFEYLQDLAVQKGLVAKADADQAIADSQAADSLLANFAQTQPAMEQSLSLMQQIAAYDGHIVQFGVNFQQYGSPLGMNGINYSQSFTPGHGSPMSIPAGSRDSGGEGIAGTPYMIGTGAQPEMFVPKTDGTFIPNADKVGATYNVVINNPVPQKSVNDIYSALRMLSRTGRAS